MSQNETLHHLNGRLVPESEMKISAFDIGLLRGFAVFDFLITYPDSQPFRLRDHIDRLYNSAKLIELGIPWSKEAMDGWVREALTANHNGQEKTIRIVVSGGVGSDSVTPNDEHPTSLIFIHPNHPYPQEMYKEGAGITTVKHARAIPGAKSNNYIEGVRRIREARAQGAVEPVYYDDEQVFEGATSNVFAVIEGKLYTPNRNILPGITRKVLLEILDLNEAVEVGDFPVEKLREATEVFLTASNKEVMPVTVIDGQPVGNGQVGRVTREVMNQFRAYTESDIWR
ncbi:MAG: amino acid aminotransferase [Candidatus Pacebacteria bacterium CG_4_10_14_0_8_um_filter_43_12]|nr:MAG: amino acid aminotransferase [Candidatus Pacebacteria bacterium CG10_big_fil_rev_8_21_14_0_10_44_11]PIY79574.1 MAG: amino acid aminotransferase [Candidatus Pacebacteria bacterium CG_4_10_14_0_8_um_filter_43_12]